MNTYNSIFNYVNNKFSNKVIIEKDISLFKKHINIYTVCDLLKNIIEDEDLLKKISDRSYTHALGFDKIVLIDLSKDISDTLPKTQLRLHLWHPEINGVPMIESLHEHSFDFISTVLTGKLENQIFDIQDLDDKDLELLRKYELELSKLNEKQYNFVNQQIEILEAYHLKSLGSEQFDVMNMETFYNKEECKKLLNMNETEFNKLCTLEKHYISNRIRGERKKYKHVFNKYIKLVPFDVLKVNSKDYYFHPYQKPHRLYYDNKILNSTILITTPVKENPQGGSLQRPSYLNTNEKEYDKIPMNSEILKNKLSYFLEFLLNYSDLKKKG